jgi:LPPG:FO 2-phospho-L-lactate transferase
LREALRDSAVPVIAISPIVGGEALKGPLRKMMREMSVPTKASWVAGHYRDFLDGFVIDSTDESLASEVEAMGITTTTTNVVMKTLSDRVQLAETSLEFIASLSERNWAKAVPGV